MTVLGIGLPDISKTTKALISRNKYGEQYVSDRNLRAKISIYRGLFINLVFVAFYAYTGLRYASYWFGAVAVYYIILSIMRFILLRNTRKVLTRENELRTYRFCGYLMFALNLGMAGMIIQMVWQNQGYEYSGLTIYASAMYAFYCMVMAIIDLVKFRKMENPILSAAKMLGFAGALMSMLALQTAMISHFNENGDSFRRIMNTASGGAVFLIAFFMAIFMVVRANRELKKNCINITATQQQPNTNNNTVN
jgi:hypothetical protein